MSFKQIFSREQGTIMEAVISMIAAMILYFGDFIHLKEKTNETFAAAFYIFSFIVIYLIWIYFKEKLANKKVKINPVFYAGEKNKNFVGSSFFCGLEIEIPKEWDVTECYAVLEHTNPIYNSDRKYFDESIREYLNHSDKQYKRLSWNSPYASGCKNDIGGYSNKEIVNVAQINIGAYVTKNQNMNIESFEFSFCQTKQSEYPHDIFGLHEVSISIHWKLDGYKRTPILFDGYLFSKVETDGNGGIHPTLILRKGDYREDKEIPSPLFRIK